MSTGNTKPSTTVPNLKTLRVLVHEANAAAHDFCSELHDRNVPYIHRKKTQCYYWGLIKNAIQLGGLNLKNASVLELGCGTGTFTPILERSEIDDFTGIDLSSKMILKARSKTNDPRFNFHVDSLENFASKNTRKYDLIFSTSFLHHLENLDDGITAIKNLLKPGGIYVGLHEVINSRQLTRLERFDEALQFTFNYAGSAYWSRKVKLLRIAQRIPLINRLLPIFHRISNIRHRFAIRTSQQLDSAIRPHNEAPKPTIERSSTLDLVDYQLNKPFSLSSNASKYGVVTKYSYLAFPELFVFGKPLNHEMLTIQQNTSPHK